MAYLSCPNCGMTLLNRNPLIAPTTCGRCARRGTRVDLRAVPSIEFGRKRGASQPA